jgi:hypothetical integral membrane protein (TIGR02206 family)
LNSFFEYNQDFYLFGSQHLWMMGLTLLLCIFLPWWSKRYLKEGAQLWLARVMGLILSVAVITYPLIRLYLGDFDLQTDLPLDICNILGLAMPFLIWHPRYQVHEVIYFWVLAGTLQAVLTPHLYNGFPNFTFLKYWVVHGGLILVIVYCTVVFRLYPSWRSIFKSFAFLQLYAFGVFSINLLIGSNYVYLMGKPPTASPLDYLGPWPWYLLVVEALCLVMFILVYLPLRFSPKRNRNGKKQPFNT